MQDNNEHIDAIFKNALENAQIPAPDSVWLGVSNATSVTASAARSSSIISILKVVGIVVGTSAAAYAVYVFTKPNKVEEIADVVKVLKPTEITPNIIINEMDNNNASILKKDIEFKTLPKVDVPKVKFIPNANEPNKTPMKNYTTTQPQTPIIGLPSGEDNPTKGKSTFGDNLANMEVKASGEIKLSKNTENIPEIVQIGFLESVPNSFTPNNDGKNDSFYVLGKNLIKFKMTIFDPSYRTILFTSTNINEKWDGKYNGNNVTTGSYNVLLQYVTENNGKEKVSNYKLELIRNNSK